jgi:site-specific recombinase XerD
MTFTAALKTFIRERRLHRSPATCLTEYEHLRNFQKHLRSSGIPFRSVTGRQVMDYLLRRTCCQKVKHDALHGINLFYRSLQEKRLLTANPADGMVINAPPRRALPAPPPQKDMRRLCQGLQRKAEKSRLLRTRRAGLRSLLLLEIAYGSGLRRAELAALNTDSLNLTEGTASVRGKGNKERIVPLTVKAVRVLRQYLAALPKPQKPLFCSRFGSRLTAKNVGWIFRKHTGINPHRLRHACATHLLQNGCSTRIIQQLLGHEGLESTQVYTHLDKRELADIINRNHPRGIKAAMKDLNQENRNSSI